MSESPIVYVCRAFLHCVLSECTINLSVESFCRCSTTTLKKFRWSQKAGSAEQFKEGGTHGQSWSELKSTLLLLPRHSISHWTFICMPATCQEHTTDTLSIKMSKRGNGSSSTLQGWLTTANRNYRSMSVVQSQPPSWQGQLLCIELHDTVLGHLPHLVLPVQGQPRHFYTSPWQW